MNARVCARTSVLGPSCWIKCKPIAVRFASALLTRPRLPRIIWKTRPRKSAYAAGQICLNLPAAVCFSILFFRVFPLSFFFFFFFFFSFHARTRTRSQWTRVFNGREIVFTMPEMNSPSGRDFSSVCYMETGGFFFSFVKPVEIPKNSLSKPVLVRKPPSRY